MKQIQGLVILGGSVILLIAGGIAALSSKESEPKSAKKDLPSFDAEKVRSLRRELKSQLRAKKRQTNKQLPPPVKGSKSTVSSPKDSSARVVSPGTVKDSK